MDYVLGRALKNDKSFEDVVFDFAKICTGVDLEVEDFEKAIAENYFEDGGFAGSINDAKEEINRIEKMTEKQKEEEFNKSVEEDFDFGQKQLDINTKGQKYFEEMLSKAKKWKASKEYKDLKQEIVEALGNQLARCNSEVSFYEDYLIKIKEKKQDGYKIWYKMIVKCSKDNLKYFKEKQREEVKRAKEDIKHLKDLKKFLKNKN